MVDASGGQWYQGWGFWYQSPDGSVNHATKTSTTNPSVTGQVTPVPANAGSAPAPPVLDPTTASSNKSAKAQIEQTLGNYGLSSLADFAWQEYLKAIPIEQIMLDIRQTPEYKQRFPAMQELANKGQAITEGQYINYETSAASIMKAAGLPAGFYDQPDDFANFLTSNIALPELQSRIDVAKQAVYNSDPATLQALQQYYGVNGGGNHIGDATAYFLDPNKALPAIQQQMIAAQEGGAAARSGYGNLAQSDAERLATLGVDPNAAQKQFGTLATLAPLFNNLPGEGGEAPTAAQGLSATFENNAQAQLAITNEQDKRKAAFQGGGGFSQSQAGMTGI
jgi:hypothetical protein